MGNDVIIQDELRENDDFSGAYLNNRQNTEIVDLEERARAMLSSQKPKEEEPEGRSIAADLGRGAVEIASGKAIASGLSKAASSTLSLGEDIDNFLLDKGLDTPVLQFTDPETGEFDLDFVKRSEFNEKLAAADVENKLGTIETDSVTGGLAAGIVQFLAGFAGAGKFIKAGKEASAATKIGVDAVKGAVADFTVFEGMEGRLTDLAAEHGFESELTNFLKTEADDSAIEGRLKNAVEGVIPGVLVDPFITAVKGLRSANIERMEANKLKQTAEDVKKLADIEPEMAKLDVGEVDAPAFEVGKRDVEVIDSDGVVQKAGKEAAVNINLSRLNSTDEVKDVITSVAKKFSKEINAERREKITFEETEKLADDLGMTTTQLLERRKGETFNAEELLASRRILLSSGEQLTTLAREVSELGANASPADLMRVQRALSQHKAIQAQVSGATAEAGRALSANRIIAKSAREQQSLIDEALNANGGAKVVREKVQALANLQDPTQINTAARQMDTATTRAMVYEAWINGLLTNPATHSANILSNSLVLLSSPLERKLASYLGTAIGDPAIPSGETSAMLFGMMGSISDAFQVMSHTFKTGIPASQIQKIENVQRKAITAENVQQGAIGKAFKGLTGEELNINGTLGRGIDLYGEFARLPGRALSASDDFFQLLAYRAELHAQSYRQAVGEGLDGEELAARVKDLTSNPPDNIHSEASNFQHYATFTDEMGDIGKAFGSISRIPGGRVISPFIRTPSRVFAYSMERTPISFALGGGNAGVGGAIRADITAGGARRDMALAKMAGGSMVMAMGAELAMSNLITGNGPQNPQARKIWMMQNKPNSIRVGNEWVSYNRLDPVAMPIAIAAEMTEILGELEDAEASDLAMAAVIGTSKSLMSRTFVKSQSDLYSAILGASVDPEANNFKSRRIIENLIGSTVPSGVANIGRQSDRTLRDTYDPEFMFQMINKVKSRLPGWSKDLNPRLNLWAEPIVLGGGLGPDILSPFYSSEIKEDPIEEEMIAQKIPIRFPSKNIDGVPLTADEYHEYQILTATQRVGGNNLKKSFSRVIKSPQYKRGTREMKELLIQKTYNNHKAAARAKLMKDSRRTPNGLAQRIEAKKRADKMKLRGAR